MTTEDLILGHFDGTLTPEQEARLQAEVRASSEARVLFEQHRSLDAMLNADAASLAPSSRLDKAVVAAALSAVPETIGGGGALSWLTTKVAVGISAAVVGGLSILVLSNSGSDDKPVPAAPAPVVRTAPVPSQAAPPTTVEAPKSEAERVAGPSAPVGEEVRKEDAPRSRSNAKTPQSAAKTGTAAARTPNKPGLRIDTSDPATIKHPIQSQADEK